MAEIHNRDAELALIVSVILYPDAFEDCSALVSADSFSWKPYGDIWLAIGRLREAGMVVDTTTIAEQMKRDGTIHDLVPHNSSNVTGEVALAFIQSTYIPFMESPLSYARIVADYAARRRIIHSIRNAAQWVSKGRGALEVISDLYASLSQIRVPGQASQNVHTLADLAKTESDRVFSQEPRRSVPFSITEIDRIYAGMDRGDLVIVAALPGVGKTAFLLNVIFRHLRAKSGVKFMLFSLEMPAEQIYRRLVSMVSGIPYHKQLHAVMSPEEWNTYAKATEYMASQSNLHICDSASLSPHDIRYLALQTRPDVVIVDYLQLLMPPPSSVAQRRHEIVAEIVRNLKQVARELDVPVVAAAQLNREAAHSSVPVPQHLAESSAIEQTADAVFVLRRPIDEVGLPSDEVTVYLTKCRNGPLGMTTLRFEGKKNLFQNQ